MVYFDQLCKDVKRWKELINDQNDQLGTIRDYYDHNTARFLSYGEQRKTRTIHRPVWGEGVKDAFQALHYVHNLILDDLRASLQGISGDVHVLDMGCGVGASLFYLAANLDVELNCVGLTISPEQIKIASEEQEDQDTEQKCKFVLGDFLKPPLRKGFNLIYAIESFAHSAAPDSFLKAAAELLKPGGRLVLCDDFLVRSSQGNLISNREKRWLGIFQSKWRVEGLSGPGYVKQMAREVGLILLKDIDLTPSLRINPLPSLVVELLSAAIGVLPGNSYYWQSVIGGQALQLCLANQVVEYRYLVFDKRRN